MLSGSEEHVELAWIRFVGDGARQGEQLVGGIAHRRNDDHELAAARPLSGDACGYAPDSVGVGDG